MDHVGSMHKKYMDIYTICMGHVGSIHKKYMVHIYYLYGSCRINT